MKIYNLLILLLVSCSTQKNIENKETNKYDQIKPRMEMTTSIYEDLNIELSTFNMFGKDYVIDEEEYYYQMLYLIAFDTQINAKNFNDLYEAKEIYYILLAYQPDNLHLKEKIYQLEEYLNRAEKLYEEAEKRLIGAENENN